MHFINQFIFLNFFKNTLWILFFKLKIKIWINNYIRLILYVFFIFILAHLSCSSCNILKTYLCCLNLLRVNKKV
jgi:hypothetical protein